MYFEKTRIDWLSGLQDAAFLIQIILIQIKSLSGSEWSELNPHNIFLYSPVSGNYQSGRFIGP